MKSIIGRRSYHNDDFERGPTSCAAILDRELVPQTALTKKFADDRDERAPCRSKFAILGPRRGELVRAHHALQARAGQVKVDLDTAQDTMVPSR